jgi:hypothetical protein
MPEFGRPAPDASAGNARIGDRLIAIFLMGAVLLHPLLIGVFDAGAGRTVFGVPLLFVYLFALWAVLIVGLRLALQPGRPATPRSGPPRAGPPRSASPIAAPAPRPAAPSGARQLPDRPPLGRG